MTEANPLVLGAIFYENFELLDVYGPLEMFGSLGPELRIATVAERAGAVAELDLLLLPGGIGTLAELGNEPMLEFLRKRSATARTTMSVCSGSAILAKAGILDGHRATSNKQFFELARSQSDKVDWVEAARWVEDSGLVTSSGVSAGMDMALAVIAGLFGSERAEQIAVLTEYEWQRDPSHDPFVKYLNQGQALASG
jgi:putative intracellular protease/amidase